MGKQLTNISFKEWLSYVFDHPVDELKNAWYWNLDRDWWDENATDSIQFLTQAFENAAAVFRPYSDAQLNQGLWFIASNSCSNHMFALMDENVPGMRDSAVFTPFINSMSNALPNGAHLT